MSESLSVEREQREFIDISQKWTLEQYEPMLIQQHYYGCRAESEFRVRQIGDDKPEFTAALKVGSGIERTELEVAIGAGCYEYYKQHSERTMTKNRYQINETTHIDELLDPSLSLLIYENENPRGLFESPKLTSRQLARPTLDAPESTPDNQELVLEDLTRKLLLASKEHHTPVLAIGGSSASGKTTIARRLAEQIDAHVISVDNYNRGQRWLQANSTDFVRTKNWDLPEVYDTQQLADSMQRLRSGEPAQILGDFDFDLCERGGRYRVDPGQPIIVEGLYALTPEIARLADITVAVDAPFAVRLHRRVERDLSRTLWSAEKIARYCVEQAEPVWRELVPKQATTCVIT